MATSTRASLGFGLKALCIVGFGVLVLQPDGGPVLLMWELLHRPLAPLTEPRNVAVANGETARFVSGATGTDTAVAWAYSLDDGRSFEQMSRGTLLEIGRVEPWMDGVLFRASIETAGQTTLTPPIRLTVMP